MYVPGTTRGPCDAAKATWAARGTRGGFTRMGHETRFSPRRFVAEIVSTSLPPASSTSSLIGPYTCLERW